MINYQQAAEWHQLLTTHYLPITESLVTLFVHLQVNIILSSYNIHSLFTNYLIITNYFVYFH